MGNLNNFSDNEFGFIAISPSTVHAYSLAERVARFNVPVLITGDTGTGKECIAKYIHNHAVGNKFAYVGVNCAAIPENMLEAVLFGYEKGAFTGAVNSMPGKFEQANGGTLLLDEIGDMPLTLQAKLLRVLQEREVERLGSNKSIPLDIRVIAMTNKNLEVEIAEGRFRQDLYYRLSVMPIHIEPLRERPEDIVPLAKQFIGKYRSFHSGEVELTEEAREALCQYHWPGNVRELENIIQRGLIMSNDGILTAAHFGLKATDDGGVMMTNNTAPGTAASKIQQRGQFAEYQYIVDLLKRYKGNKSKTAEFLGITPRALRYRLASMRANGFDIECFS
ncbi:MAG: sigma-54 interaction domain-containing protein [Enterobacteriaceae bacterium]